VSVRNRVYLNVAIATAVAIAIVVGLTLDTRTDPAQPAVFSGKPPVPQGLTGVPGAQIDKAYREWPNGSIGLMQQLGLTYPTSSVVQFYRGFALLWAGYPSDASSAFELAKTYGANDYYGALADNILHKVDGYYQPTIPPYFPVFVPTEKNALLERGSQLQKAGQQVSALGLYLRAVAAKPDDAEAQVAVAVAHFDENDLNASFGRLGPLTARFPRSQAVHYYLGYLLDWIDQPSEAITQFEDTVRLGAGTQLGRTAKNVLLEMLRSAEKTSNKG
jgi:tetratricopeptide (TPR) repeat protein